MPDALGRIHSGASDRTPERLVVRPSPLAGAAAAFLLGIVMSAAGIWKLASVGIHHMREHAGLEAASHAHALAQSIERSLSATYALAALVREGGGAIRNFDAVARQMLPLYPGASSLQLAPGGVVRNIVPLAGNEQAIGHDLLKDPARTSAAFRARDTGQLTLDGPFALLQGGMGAVGRLPVFLEGAEGPAFWGFASVLIEFPEALEVARFAGLAEQGLAYQLWRIDSASGRKRVIAASSSAAMVDPVEERVRVANTTWTLSVEPVRGWRQDPLASLLLGTLGVVFSALLGWVAKLMIELRDHKRGLEALVEERTAEVKAREADLNKAQSVAKVGSWALDLQDQELQLSAEAARVFGAAAGTVFDRQAFLARVPPDDRDAVDGAWRNAVAGLPLDMEHRIVVGAETRWVHTRGELETTPEGAGMRLVGTVRDITERHVATERLRDALEGTIGALAATMESRDPSAAGHQLRVAALAAAIATEMGLPDSVVEGIRLGALIHDLGKMQVPAEILSKPARLTRLEYELVKTHVQAGYEILKGIDFPWPIALMVLQHHERLDGSGYPRGLKGAEICPEARILALADVVEAMSSHRPYRPALGVEAALAQIEAGSGTGFEPAIVAACLRLFREKGFTFEGGMA